MTGSMLDHVERRWVDAIRTAQVFVYQLPDETFEPAPDVGGYWLSRVSVEPIGMVALGDLARAIADRDMPSAAAVTGEVELVGGVYAGRCRRIEAGGHHVENLLSVRGCVCHSIS
jgi:hypothetical protein